MTSTSERYERLLAAIAKEYPQREEQAQAVLRMLREAGVVDEEDEAA